MKLISILYSVAVLLFAACSSLALADEDETDDYLISKLMHRLMTETGEKQVDPKVIKLFEAMKGNRPRRPSDEEMPDLGNNFKKLRASLKAARDRAYGMSKKEFSKESHDALVKHLNELPGDFESFSGSRNFRKPARPSTNPGVELHAEPGHKILVNPNLSDISGKSHQAHCEPHRVRAFAWHPNGSRLAVGTGSGTGDPHCKYSGSVQFYDMTSSRPVLLYTSGVLKYRVSSMSYNPNGTQLAVAGGDTLWILDPDHPASPVETLKKKHKAITSLSYSPDGTRLLATGQSGLAQIHSTKQLNNVLLTLAETGVIYGAAFLKEGAEVALRSSKQKVTVYHAGSGTVLRTEESSDAMHYRITGLKHLTTAPLDFWVHDPDTPSSPLNGLDDTRLHTRIAVFDPAGQQLATSGTGFFYVDKVSLPHSVEQDQAGCRVGDIKCN